METLSTTRRARYALTRPSVLTSDMGSERQRISGLVRAAGVRAFQVAFLQGGLRNGGVRVGVEKELTLHPIVNDFFATPADPVGKNQGWLRCITKAARQNDALRRPGVDCLLPARLLFSPVERHLSQGHNIID